MVIGNLCLWAYFLYYNLVVILLDSGAAKDKENLTSMGITHVLNAAQGRMHHVMEGTSAEYSQIEAENTVYSMVDTNAEYYQDVDIIYLGFPLRDIPTVNITTYLYDGANFIDDALRSDGEWTYCTYKSSASCKPDCILYSGLFPF